jgi:protein tyrosine phosphatase (PTP) superfamily phosphohydrolase (DUF442 family)
MGLLVALALIGLGAETVRVVFGANFHVVIPDQIYRCAQPTPALLAWLVREHGIRTVVNLRGIGDGPTVDWYEKEAQACQSLGLSHENLTFSASRLPNVDEVRRLLEVLDRSEKPIVLHCRRGADRTGLASAIALLSQTDTPYAEARASIGIRYGHWELGSAGRLGAFFEEYETWLRREHLTHDKSVFRRWLLNDYVGGCCRYEIVSVEPMQDRPQANTVLAYRITFRNTSGTPWKFSSSPHGGIHVGVLTFDLQRGGVKSNCCGYLDRTVAPGETIEVTTLLPELYPGRHRVMVDLIDQGHAWFSQVGSVPWEEELYVRD